MMMCSFGVHCLWSVAILAAVQHRCLHKDRSVRSPVEQGLAIPFPPSLFVTSVSENRSIEADLRMTQ